MASNKNEKRIRLTSSDGQEFVVPIGVAKESNLIRDMMESEGVDKTSFPLSSVDSRTLKKVLEYCEKHAEEAEKKAMAEADGISSAVEASKEHLKEWDKEFAEVELDLLYDLLMASYYLGVNGILHLLAQRVANMVRGKNTEEIRNIFRLKNDFTPEEEEEISREHPWAFP